MHKYAKYVPLLACGLVGAGYLSTETGRQISGALVRSMRCVCWGGVIIAEYMVNIYSERGKPSYSSHQCRKNVQRISKKWRGLH
jgi:hypothetical protein